MVQHDFWLLDLDGTILTVEESYIHETIGQVGDALGRTFSDEAAVAIWYGRDGLRNDILTQGGVTPAEFWAAFHEIEDPIARAEATRLHPDATAVTELDGPRAIVTHCQPYLLEPIFDRLDIRDWFDVVVTGSDELGRKPDPAPLHRAMTTLEVDGGTGAMVGDSVADLEAARHAGVTAVLIDRDGSVDPSIADRVVTSLDGLA